MFEDALIKQTAFGMGAQWKGASRADHEVLDDSAWNAIPLLRTLKDNAMRQLVPVGRAIISRMGNLRLNEPLFGLRPGVIFLVLSPSHSGSRSVGY